MIQIWGIRSLIILFYYHVTILFLAKTLFKKWSHTKYVNLQSSNISGLLCWMCIWKFVTGQRGIGFMEAVRLFCIRKSRIKFPRHHVLQFSDGCTNRWVIVSMGCLRFDFKLYRSSCMGVILANSARSCGSDVPLIFLLSSVCFSITAFIITITTTVSLKNYSNMAPHKYHYLQNLQ